MTKGTIIAVTVVALLAAFFFLPVNVYTKQIECFVAPCSPIREVETPYKMIVRIQKTNEQERNAQIGRDITARQTTIAITDTTFKKSDTDKSVVIRSVDGTFEKRFVFQPEDGGYVFWPLDPGSYKLDFYRGDKLVATKDFLAAIPQKRGTIIHIDFAY